MYQQIIESYAATEKLIDEVEHLNRNTPCGIIFDADTILSDLIEDSDHEATGLAQSIFDIWKSSADKKAVEEVFCELVGMEFREYLLKCKEEIAR